MFRLLFLILLILLLAMRIYFNLKVRRAGGRITPDKQAVDREGKAGVIIRVAGFFLLLVFLVMYLLGMFWIDAFSFPLPSWLRWAGFALGLISVAFWTWAQAALDTQFSAQLQLTEGHRLITTGSYSRIRHPLYTAMIAWTVSLALLSANRIFVAMVSLTVAGVVWRVPKEEQMLLDAFGDEYRAYMQNTGRFFPKFKSG